MITAAPPTETAARLDIHQMAQFVMDGYLEFDDLVPADINAAVYEDQLGRPAMLAGSPARPTCFWTRRPRPRPCSSCRACGRSSPA